MSGMASCHVTQSNMYSCMCLDYSIANSELGKLACVPVRGHENWWQLVSYGPSAAVLLPQCPPGECLSWGAWMGNG